MSYLSYLQEIYAVYLLYKSIIRYSMQFDCDIFELPKELATLHRVS